MAQTGTQIAANDVHLPPGLDHIHTQGTPQATDIPSAVIAAQGADALAYGLSFWTVDPRVTTAGQVLSVNVLRAHLVRALKTETINKLGAWVGVAGATPGTGVNGVAIYSVAGVLLGSTGDMTSAFTSAGYSEGTISGGAAVTAGTAYYLCIQHNLGTGPTMPSATAAGVNIPAIRGVYSVVFFSGQTSWPASFTPSSGSPINYTNVLTAGT